MVPPTNNLATCLSSSQSANGNFHWGFVHLWAQLVAKAPRACTKIRRFCSLNVTDSNKQQMKVFFQWIDFFGSINGTHLPTRGCIKRITLSAHILIYPSVSQRFPSRHLKRLPTFLNGQLWQIEFLTLERAKIWFKLFDYCITCQM